MKSLYIILVYDISIDNNGQKVLRKVYKTCKKYMVHVQNSVFEGDLSDVQLVKLKLELDKYIRRNLDSIILFKSRNEKWLQKDFWGIREDMPSNFF